MSCCATLALSLIAVIYRQDADAQSSPPPPNLPTVNGSVTLNATATYTQLLPATALNSFARRSLTIQNNNTNGDLCWIFIGSAAPTTPTSIQLAQGIPYQRYFPYVPNDKISGTCASTGDSIYVDTQ
jgi:hypothetical protein